ncbi:MAG: RdgB/HAM1 family non-canonical purine NTP pyrophosphatase [Simkaniaceae bacterium]|nr:RdgB/HAM1 family non-canonical purine NTP pyrophosphatase [Candidatus Sacchlamyda saccharinae]
MKLVIASKNMHKVREIRAILRQTFKDSSKWDVYSLMDFPHYVPPAETGETFEENAILKATHAAKTLQAYALADDSGLVVPALKGKPGVLSARFAGENATDKDNRKKLLKDMQELKESDRDAYFECSMAIATPNGLDKSVSARCEGMIVEEERGGQGFGYDSIFKKHDYSKVFAELEEEVKNRISHRRKALDKILLHMENSVLSN